MLSLPLLSRSGHTSPFGKLTPMPTVRLGDATVEKLRCMASAEGLPWGEFVRTLLEIRAHGAGHVASVAAERVRRVSGIDSATDHH